jgi:Activator of Hsp90 ATPase homolog 1-like protein
MMVKTVLLPLEPDAAFALFTQRAGEWWPEDRRHTQDPASAIFLLESGRFFERARDGREVDLGRVRAWSTERILLDFFIATGPDQPTEVEVTFVAEAGGTRVTITHGPTPASAALWTQRASRYAASWDAVLNALLAAAG